MTSKLIIANWKTYITHAQALALGKQLPSSENIIVAPSIAHMAFIKEHLPDLNLATQDISGIAEGYGTYTGEVPAQMIADMGIRYAIIGHSERRSSGLDNQDSISAKVSHCLASSIIPIICLGETQEERKNNQYLEAITTQLLNIRKVLEDFEVNNTESEVPSLSESASNEAPIETTIIMDYGLNNTRSQMRNLSERKVYEKVSGTTIIMDYGLNNTRSQMRNLSFIGEQRSDEVGLTPESIIIAYEPVWSVGTGVLPSCEEISEIMNLIRSTLGIARKLVLVYGGSVNAENAKDIVNIAGVDGVLIGKASTDFEHFKSILDIIR